MQTPVNYWPVAAQWSGVPNRTQLCQLVRGKLLMCALLDNYCAQALLSCGRLSTLHVAAAAAWDALAWWPPWFEGMVVVAVDGRAVSGSVQQSNGWLWSAGVKR